MPSFRRALHAFRTATIFTTSRPAYAAGVRASIATVIPLAAGQLLDHQGAATWMSLGGFNGALADKGGSYSSRAWTMTALMGTSAFAAAIATVVSGHLTLVLLATFAVAFFTSVLRVWAILASASGAPRSPCTWWHSRFPPHIPPRRSRAQAT